MFKAVQIVENKQTIKTKKNINGFTLIELLVVVAIIGTLASVGTVAYNGYTSAAKKTVALANQKTVIKYIVYEVAKCELQLEEVSMDGNLDCSDKTTAAILTAVQASLKDKIKNPYNSSQPGICVSTDPCGGKYSYTDAKSIGVVNLHLIDATGTIRIGTCTDPYPNGVSCEENNVDSRNYLFG